jgi:hypothetical protein
MTEPTTLREKSAILFRLGLLREQDRNDPKRIASRWLIYETTPQKTIRDKKATETEKAA